MSFDEEWAAAKVAVRLNQAPAPGGGGGSADLSVSRDDLGAIGGEAYQLHGRLAKDGHHADRTTADAAAALVGSHFETGAALRQVSDTWSQQVIALQAACAQISNHLDYSAAAHQKDDDDIAGALMSVAELDKHFR
ncbi:hypothetical protein [Streptomyces sp. NPDC085540]|uniref:hypothetical protein n=1 Tax=Streptomyces sp. NPDC085540 TaxID=3365730 RepID=UPI0037D5C160